MKSASIFLTEVYDCWVLALEIRNETAHARTRQLCSGYALYALWTRKVLPRESRCASLAYLNLEQSSDEIRVKVQFPRPSFVTILYSISSSQHFVIVLISCRCKLRLTMRQGVLSSAQRHVSRGLAFAMPPKVTAWQMTLVEAKMHISRLINSYFSLRLCATMYRLQTEWKEVIKGRTLLQAVCLCSGITFFIASKPSRKYELNIQNRFNPFVMTIFCVGLCVSLLAQFRTSILQM